jgi:hypothetical protein
MATLIAALLDLQAVERQLAQVRARLKTRTRAVSLQKQRIDQLRLEHDALHERAISRRKEADRLELELKTDEERVSRLRTSLNTARTNKEYAAILTQINTTKADNAKIEEEALRILQEVDGIRAEAEAAAAKLHAEEQRLAEIERRSSEEISRLQAMREELEAKRSEAAAEVPPKALAVFERIARSYDGDAMAMVEQHGKRPPFSYVCGGCFMSLNPEHANALRTRDEIRTCDNCGRILYLESQKQNTPA